MSSEKYRDFVRWMVFSRKVSFHPDTPMAEYVNIKNGKRVFGDEQAAVLQEQHDRLLGEVGDPYAVAIDIFEEWERRKK